MEWRREAAELQELEMVSGGNIQGCWNPKTSIVGDEGIGLSLGYPEGGCYCRR